MSRYLRDGRRRSKIFLYNELASYYGLHRHTVRQVLVGVDLMGLSGAIEAIHRLDGYVLDNCLPEKLVSENNLD